MSPQAAPRLVPSHRAVFRSTLCPEGRNGWWLKTYPAEGALASCTIKRVLSANRKSSQEDENEKCKHALGVAGSAWAGPGGIEVEQI